MRFLKPYRGLVAVTLLVLLVDNVGTLLVPTMLANMVNTGITTGDVDYILRNGLYMLIATGMASGGAVLGCYLSARLAANVACDIRNAVYDKSLELSASDFERFGTGSMITRSLNDINVIQQAILQTIQLVLPVPFLAVAGIIFAWFIDPAMGTLLGVVVAVVLVAAVFTVANAAPIFMRLQSFIDRMNVVLRENIVGVRVIRAFGKEKQETESFENKSGELLSSQLFVGKISALLNPVTYVMINLAIIAVLRVGGGQVYKGILTQGQVLALYNYMSQILVELIKMANLILSMTKATASAKRVAAILALESSLDVPQENPEEPEAVPAVEFDGVTFTYPTGGAPALSDISFTLEHGKTLGIIGGTGSGKSTLIGLIPRFYDVQKGSVKVDGCDVKQYPLDTLRRKIGLVPQKALLFKGTIRENLLWGDEGAADDAIYDALKAAQAQEVVDGKPEGLDYEVETGGRNFSGGQRQRLTIARALVRKPEVLILDDSASALDFATDAALRHALRELPWKPAVVIISQRTASIRFADEILVLDDGKLAGRGTHEELLQTCDVYREIYESQFKKEDAR